MGHEDLKHYVAKPDEVKANKMSCMLGFSDQVPVWVKKGSTKAVFAAHETRTHGKPIKQIRRDLQDELNKQAHDKKLVDEAEHHDALEGENPNESHHIEGLPEGYLRQGRTRSFVRWSQWIWDERLTTIAAQPKTKYCRVQRRFIYAILASQSSDLELIRDAIPSY